MTEGSVTRVAYRKLSRLAIPCLLCALCAWIGGCGTLDESELAARQYRQADYEARFRIYRSRCLARGGRIMIDARSSLARDGMPRRGDRYACT